MAEPERIGVEEVRRKLKSGEVLLVCAYDDEERFRSWHREGALSPLALFPLPMGAGDNVLAEGFLLPAA